jgi:hypothetical protein
VALEAERIHVIADEAELRGVIGDPSETVLLKRSALSTPEFDAEPTTANGPSATGAMRGCISRR